MQVLLMLSESGVLFLSEFTPLGRRWVMPLRSPERRPLELLLNAKLIAPLFCMQVMPMRLPERRPTSVDTSWAAARHGAQVSVSADVCLKATVGVSQLWLPP
jgi:hypothetical protein